MNEFDRIIGYAEVKRQLVRIADALKNTGIYAALGAVSPRGLLLYGEPGVGKTLMAQCLIEASGREAYVCRKTESDGAFLDTIRETFERAAENEPSIVFLDDMDKFANEDNYHRDAEEYVTIQSCIDEVKEREVFVLATVNDMGKLPDSLKRAGRFDWIIGVNNPEGKDAVDIIRYYLSNKTLDGDMDAETIAAILGGRSCAVLETVINEAGLLAGFQRADHVTMQHIMEAGLEIEYGVVPETFIPIDLSKDGLGARTVYHEAGHTVIAELLAPGSVILTLVKCTDGKTTGSTKLSKKSDYWDLRSFERDIMVSLAGRATEGMRYGIFDVGASKDLDRAFATADRLIEDHCLAGFDLYDWGKNSQELTARQETAAAVEVARYDRLVRELLVKNRDFLEAVAHALAEKGVLLAADIRAIRESCGITAAAV